MNGNRSDARAYRIPGGYIGQFRPVWRAEYETVHEPGSDKPMIFSTEAEAERAAWRVLRDISEPVVVSTGLIPGKHKAAAERLFKVRAEA